MLKTMTREILHLRELAVSKWEAATHSQEWTYMQRYNYWEKRVNEKYLIIATERLLEILKPLKPEDFQTESVQKQLEAFFINAILQCPFLLEEEKKYLCNSAQLSASKQFIDQFLKEDSQLKVEDLGQAMRNFWIANLLQAAFGMPIENTEALYGYSMLYPYTDNLMDDLTQDKSQKNAFCMRLTEKLLGHTIEEPLAPNELRIHALVDKIYAQYPVDQFVTPQLGLLAIHDAQAESLKQQQQVLMPYEIDLLGKSFYKGGTSLIADGFLVKPDMSPNEQAFCFAFGAILQLCDDLQDIEGDLRAHHYTLFSQLKSHYALDPLLDKLNGYLEATMAELDEIYEQKEYDLPLVIARNTRLLLLYAILDNERCFTKPYVQKIYEYLPIRPVALKKVLKKVRREARLLPLFQRMPSKTSLTDYSVADMKKDLTNIS